MSGTSGRLLSLLSLLQARRDWPGQVLAERLGVSGRTVRRDVDRLRDLGYPIHATLGPDGGYRLAPGTDLPPLLFDDEQAVALAIALQLAATSGAGITDGAARALATLRQVMPTRLRHRVDSVRLTAIPQAPSSPPVDAAALLAVSDAVRSREVLRFDYRSDQAQADGEPGPARRVQPHHLLARGGRWYLLGWDLDRADWRTFRVERMVPRTPTGPRFAPREVPGGDAAAFVAARFKGSDGDDAWPCRGEVLLDLPAAEVAPYASEGTVEAVAPSRCRVTLGAWSWHSLAATVARFDATFEVVGPPELARALDVLSARFATAAASFDHGGTTDAGPRSSRRRAGHRTG
ncbi:helix-turn-helix transcriptional regulator [Cellulomonas aerilata]|uniref:DeoR family transcriptional regulator n=1 Tax=Cellulomonas aerilata TaxID=515326 RepID=A0A512DBX6_9CELL|nr:WYL domain-containing protein [Cellulomonas aerilata]GEO33989.1 DeoR family transcriptional regulator [Cellulomonas aerilata]